MTPACYGEFRAVNPLLPRQIFFDLQPERLCLGCKHPRKPELRLAKAVGPVCLRCVLSNAIIVAPGTSCRHQIHYRTGRSALHPIEPAERMLA